MLFIQQQTRAEQRREQGAQLAEQLNYGSLPISFSIESEQQISATLGQDQLFWGLIAGLIGLALVAVYQFFQYRALGLLTFASIIVAGVLTWLTIAILGWTDNYRLSLAGIAGLIVAIGLTADSFIVYFERIKDELRAGHTVPVAVHEGWKRARRTITASKAVNLLAAVVLYFVAVGNVRGFAFTLGLTAVADLLVRDLAGRAVVAHNARFDVGFLTQALGTRGLLDRVLARPGISGILAFTLPEALWLVAHGARDVLVAYPTAERAALRRLAARTVAALHEARGPVLAAITVQDAAGFFLHCGYDRPS